MSPSQLQRALVEGLTLGGDLPRKIRELGMFTIEDPQDAQAICDGLERIPEILENTTVTGMPSSPLHAMTALFQKVGSQEAFDILAEDGLPKLLELYDGYLEEFDAASTKNSLSPKHDLMFILKIFAMYQFEPGMDRLVDAARNPLLNDDFMWSVIFGQFDEEHDYRHVLCDRLRNPLPEGFACVAYLDLVNQLAVDDDLEELHPFDNEEGEALLEKWLLDSDPDHYSYAHSATTAIPFLNHVAYNQLLALALDHFDDRVQMEGAWAAAKLGREAGVKILSRLCGESETCTIATNYLQELEREDAIPEKAIDPTFQAMAEMSHWLSHPNEYGEAPSEIELFDTREIYWPPSNDRRQVWLFKYTYQPEGDEDETEIGIGMVGGITFSLFGETTVDQSADDIYALHCCWELQTNQDPRAPHDRSVEEGRKILNDYAENF